jgi:hypothetical protein
MPRTKENALGDAVLAIREVRQSLMSALQELDAGKLEAARRSLQHAVSLIDGPTTMLSSINRLAQYGREE